MEQVKFGSDFKNQPRIGQRFIQSTAGAVSVKTKKGKLYTIIYKRNKNLVKKFNLNVFFMKFNKNVFF